MSPKRQKDAGSPPAKRKNPIHVRFGKADMDDYEELYRRFEASEIKSISTFVKHLLSKVLNPDPSSDKDIRDLLLELREDSHSLQGRFDTLDSRTKSMRAIVAQGVAALLREVAEWPKEKVEKFVQEKLTP